MSLRERTDRLRRATDSAASTERRRDGTAFYFTTPVAVKTDLKIPASNSFFTRLVFFFYHSQFRASVLLVSFLLFYLLALFPSFSLYILLRAPEIVAMNAFSISGERRLFRGYRYDRAWKDVFVYAHVDFLCETILFFLIKYFFVILDS